MADTGSVQMVQVGAHRRADVLALGIITSTVVFSQALFLLRPVAGAYAAALAFMLLVLFAGIVERYRSLATGAALLPLATIVSFSLPQETALAQTVVFYGALLGLGAMYLYLLRGEGTLLRPKHGWRTYAYGVPAVIILGELIGGLAYLLQDAYPFDGSKTLLVGGAVIVFAIAEEVVFRGLIQRQAGRLFHPAVAAVLAAVLYAGASIGFGSWPAFWTALAAGGVLAAVYAVTRSILLTTILNMTAKLVFLGLLATYLY